MGNWFKKTWKKLLIAGGVAIGLSVASHYGIKEDLVQSICGSVPQLPGEQVNAD